MANDFVQLFSDIKKLNPELQSNSIRVGATANLQANRLKPFIILEST